MNYEEDENGNLIREDGVVILEEERTKNEIYSRPVGFLRPIESWHDGKQAEFKDRKTYKVK